jgi:hypothetical protein
MATASCRDGKGGQVSLERAGLTRSMMEERSVQKVRRTEPLMSTETAAIFNRQTRPETANVVISQPTRLGTGIKRKCLRCWSSRAQHTDVYCTIHVLIIATE